MSMWLIVKIESAFNLNWIFNLSFYFSIGSNYVVDSRKCKIFLYLLLHEEDAAPGDLGVKSKRKKTNWKEVFSHPRPTWINTDLIDLFLHLQVLFCRWYAQWHLRGNGESTSKFFWALALFFLRYCCNWLPPQPNN